MFYVYILFSHESNRYYIGSSSDPWLRLNQHNNNSGDKYTGKHHDWKLMAVFEAGSTRAEAMCVERWLKRQKSRSLIIKLLDPSFVLVGELAQLVRVPHLRD